MIILLLFGYGQLSAQTNTNSTNTFVSKQIGIEFNYPKSWSKGTPEISTIYWVGIPNFKSSGNVVLKVNPWIDKPNFALTSREIYKSEILSTSIWYEDLQFIEFNKDIKVGGVNGIYSYYKGIGVVKGKIYYEILFQWWNKNLLYTLQGQFSEPALTKTQIDQFKALVNSIKLR